MKYGHEKYQSCEEESWVKIGSSMCTVTFYMLGMSLYVSKIIPQLI